VVTLCGTGAEENIWISEGGSGERIKRNLYKEKYYCLFFDKYY
jgi:hypothetical protein